MSRLRRTSERRARRTAVRGVYPWWFSARVRSVSVGRLRRLDPFQAKVGPKTGDELGILGSCPDTFGSSHGPLGSNRIGAQQVPALPPSSDVTLP